MTAHGTRRTRFTRRPAHIQVAATAPAAPPYRHLADKSMERPATAAEIEAATRPLFSGERVAA